MYNEEKAVALNDISLEFKTDDINKATDQSSLSKDKQIEDLLKELLLKDDLMGYFKKELKTYVLANRKLKKTAVETENFLVDICGRNEIEQKRKDSTIKNLKNEIEAKSALIKQLNEEWERKNWANLSKFEDNKKELDEIQSLITEKDVIISEQLVKIITQESEIEKKDERLNVLESKIYEQTIEKTLMLNEKQELGSKLKIVEQQLNTLQKHKNDLEADMIQLEIEIAKKKKNKFFSWLSKLFRSNSDLSNDKNIDNNNNNNNNNNKSLRKRIKSPFTRNASSKQTQQTNDDINDFEPTFDQTSSQ